MAAELSINNNEELKRFEYTEDGQFAFVEYRMMNGSIALVHTCVPESMAGRGIAAALTVYAFNYAKENKLPVIVFCPYIEGYLKKHPELSAQLDKEFYTT